MIIDELIGVPQAFRDFLQQRGFVYEPDVQCDLLASALGSQFVLYAGPSGTGKSTAARAISEFFADANRRAVIDTRPGWVSEEDLVGQFSVFSKTYVSGPATEAITRLHDLMPDAGSPIVTVEEANLSPMEGFLGPVISSSSSIAWKSLRWRLHDEPVNPESTSIPQFSHLGPWPRFQGTINVDASAPAPSPKVSGRACVVLLEPPVVDLSISSADAITEGQTQPVNPPGVHMIGDPRAAWADYVVQGVGDTLTSALRIYLDTLAESAGRGANIVSPRDVQRSLLFMAWYVPLARASAWKQFDNGEPESLAAETAILHFVLPGLSSEQFREALPALAKIASPDSILGRRLSRLGGGGDGIFGVQPDFWASLS